MSVPKRATLPQEVVEQIVHHLAQSTSNATSDDHRYVILRTLLSCSLLSLTWTDPAQKHIFSYINLPRLMRKRVHNPLAATVATPDFARLKQLLWAVSKSPRAKCLASYVRKISCVSELRVGSFFLHNQDRFAELLDLLPAVNHLVLTLDVVDQESRRGAHLRYYRSVLSMLRKSTIAALELEYVNLDNVGEMSELLNASKALTSLTIGLFHIRNWHQRRQRQDDWASASDQRVILRHLNMRNTSTSPEALYAAQWMMNSPNSQVSLRKLKQLAIDMTTSPIIEKLISYTRAVKSLVVTINNPSSDSFSLPEAMKSSRGYADLEAFTMVLKCYPDFRSVLNWICEITEIPQINLKRIRVKMGLFYDAFVHAEKYYGLLDSWRALDRALSESSVSFKLKRLTFFIRSVEPQPILMQKIASMKRELVKLLPCWAKRKTFSISFQIWTEDES